MHILNFISISMFPATSFLAVDAAKAESLEHMWVRVYSLRILCFPKRVRSHIGWGGARNTLYKGVEISP